MNTSGQLPNFLFISGVRRVGENPVGGGGFADVWEGEVFGRRVALKVIRIFGLASPRSELHQVRFSIACENASNNIFDFPFSLGFLQRSNVVATVPPPERVAFLRRMYRRILATAGNGLTLDGKR